MSLTGFKKFAESKNEKDMNWIVVYDKVNVYDITIVQGPFHVAAYKLMKHDESFDEIVENIYDTETNEVTNEEIYEEVGEFFRDILVPFNPTIL